MQLQLLQRAEMCLRHPTRQDRDLAECCCQNKRFVIIWFVIIFLIREPLTRKEFAGDMLLNTKNFF
ncbi:MAG: hypothetical protein D3909_02770 [Candidatus Electrothrix sp. ATG1]|nr:hypothetical protein [Candidatus Electrothrix sp. ATG1]